MSIDFPYNWRICVYSVLDGYESYSAFLQVVE